MVPCPPSSVTGWRHGVSEAVMHVVLNSYPMTPHRCHALSCHKPIRIHMEVLIQCYTLVHGFCFFRLFLMVGKELTCIGKAQCCDQLINHQKRWKSANCTQWHSPKYVIAERLSTRHLILLRGRLAFVYIYISVTLPGNENMLSGNDLPYMYMFVRVRVCVSCALHVFLGLHWSWSRSWRGT